MQRALKAMLIGSCVAVLGGGVAMATGGSGGMSGGGGMKNEPGEYGSSGSRYDPATEYTKAITALKEYKVIDMGGVRVGVIGAVTQETPSLVTPGGIADLDFGDPVEAVNRVAAQLTDGMQSTILIVPRRLSLVWAFSIAKRL